MKKIFIVCFILFLIMFTALTKNSTKKLENQIFTIKENMSYLKDRYELVLLDYNYLTSPKKLLEYQSKYFENNLILIDINKVKKINLKNKEITISEFKNE